MRRISALLIMGGVMMFAGLVWLTAAQVPASGGDLQPGVASTIVAKVDINRASLAELSRLPGITPQVAERIVKNRPYRKLDDLVVRKVLGKKQFAQIKEHIVTGQTGP